MPNAWAATGIALALAVAAAPAFAAPAPARAAELMYMLRQDCGSCHGMTLKGGLGVPLLPEALADRSDERLVASILNGVPGTPMPPWAPLLTADEAQWLVRQLREGK